MIDSCGSIRSDGPIAKKLQLRKEELISSSPSSFVYPYIKTGMETRQEIRLVVRCALFKAMFSLSEEEASHNLHLYYLFLFP